MAWLKIEDPDKSWELLHAGLLWFKSRDGGYFSYAPVAEGWQGHREVWCSIDDYYCNSKYVLLEE